MSNTITPPSQRERIATACLTAILSGPVFADQCIQAAEDEEWAALVHNTTADAIQFADNLISQLQDAAP